MQFHDVCLPLVPNPHDANEVLVPAGKLYRIDAAAGVVTTSGCCGNVQQVAFSPADRDVMYVNRH